MEAISELATNFAKYGDVITGFVVLQGLAFAISLGKKDTFALAVIGAKSVVNRLLGISAAIYVAAVIICGLVELSLRENDACVVKIAVLIALVGRVLIVGGASWFAFYAFNLQFDKNAEIIADSTLGVNIGPKANEDD